MLSRFIQGEGEIVYTRAFQGFYSSATNLPQILLMLITLFWENKYLTNT